MSGAGHYGAGMTSTVAPPRTTAQDRAEPRRVVLSLRALLTVYAVLPLCIGIAVIDAGLLDGRLRAAMPRRPEDLVWFELFFGWPHIVASTVILLTNRDYLETFGRRVGVATLLVVALFGVGFFVLPYELLFVVAATATIVHVLKQQIGIGRGAARTSTPSSARAYTRWGWAAIAAGVVLYNGLLLPAARPYRSTLVVLAGIAVVAMLGYAFRLHREVAVGTGRRFLWANTAMVAGSLAFFATGYGLLAIAVPRVVHDTTAFAFYVSHDVNRHGQQPGNRLHRWARRVPGGVAWVPVVAAIAIAWVLSEHGNDLAHLLTGDRLRDAVPAPVSLGLLGLLGMLHYYYESFTWKAGSPYRAHVSIGP